MWLVDLLLDYLVDLLLDYLVDLLLDYLVDLLLDYLVDLLLDYHHCRGVKYMIVLTYMYTVQINNIMKIETVIDRKVT